jgi:pimeloyl-ACP methyl ester carboxylesterase
MVNVERGPETMRRMAIANSEISYSERGTGEPIVLVHAGVFSDWFLPVSKSPTLDGFRVIRVRRAGYGPVSPTHHLTIRDHARHVGALADHLGIPKIHWVGHSSSCQIGLELAMDRPDLVHDLVLVEPAAGGGFTVPASEALGRDFGGPAMAAFEAGNVEVAFDTFLRGVGGDSYRGVLEGHLGREGYERALRESAFFFRDEIRAVLESQFGEDEAQRIHQPVLVVEGGEQPARLVDLARQITERATVLLPHAQVVSIEGVSHMMPLQDPDAVGRAIATFARQHPMSRTASGATQ